MGNEPKSIVRVWCVGLPDPVEVENGVNLNVEEDRVLWVMDEEDSPLAVFKPDVWLFALYLPGSA